MEFIQNYYEPITWMLVLEAILLCVPTCLLLYKLVKKEKVDLWSLVSFFGAIVVLMVSDYFPYSIYWFVCIGMLTIPCGKIIDCRMEYRVRIKREKAIGRGKMSEQESMEIKSEYVLNDYFTDEEIRAIAKEAKAKVKISVAWNIIIILIPSVIYILAGIAKGVFYG